MKYIKTLFLSTLVLIQLFFQAPAYSMDAESKYYLKLLLLPILVPAYVIYFPFERAYEKTARIRYEISDYVNMTKYKNSLSEITEELIDSPYAPFCSSEIKALKNFKIKQDILFASEQLNKCLAKIGVKLVGRDNEDLKLLLERDISIVYKLNILLQEVQHPYNYFIPLRYQNFENVSLLARYNEKEFSSSLNRLCPNVKYKAESAIYKDSGLVWDAKSVMSYADPQQYYVLVKDRETIQRECMKKHYQVLETYLKNMPVLSNEDQTFLINARAFIEKLNLKDLDNIKKFIKR